MPALWMNEDQEICIAQGIFIVLQSSQQIPLGLEIQLEVLAPSIVFLTVLLYHVAKFGKICKVLLQYKIQQLQIQFSPKLGGKFGHGRIGNEAFTIITEFQSCGLPFHVLQALLIPSMSLSKPSLRSQTVRVVKKTFNNRWNYKPEPEALKFASA